MRNNIGTRWTQGEMSKLDQLIKQGLPLKDVAVMLGRSASACRTRLYMIRVAVLFTQGSPGDTLGPAKKK